MSYKLPSREVIASLREQYPAGTRVELISMNDPHTTLSPGDQGASSFVDDIGTIFVRWDNGSGLGIVYGEDSVKKIERERQYETGADFWQDSVSKLGREEAVKVCSRYISSKIKIDDETERKFCPEIFVAMMKDTSGRADLTKLIYPYSFEEAAKHSETSHYNEGMNRNRECAQAIDKLINSSSYKPNFYNMDIATMSAIQEYGFERVNAVLAFNLQTHGTDGRYTRENKDWANSILLPDRAFEYAYLNAHPILIEAFTQHTRRLYEAVGAERFALPGMPEAGHNVQNYEIMRSIWFDDQRGFAIGHNPDAPDPYVCWKFTTGENGDRDFYWGHYCVDGKAAEDDYVSRVMVHMSDESAKEIPNPLAAAELSDEQNQNMLDGVINNEKDWLDLTDGQTHEEIQALAPETLPGEKSSVMEQIREAKKSAPIPHQKKDGISRGEPDL